jgi:hypothetical protein
VDSTGLATLRRDGFASLVAPAGGGGGSVTTRPVVWSGGGRFLFVNFAGDNLRVAVLNASTGQEIAPFGLGQSVAMTNDTTRAQMHWEGETAEGGLSALAGQPVRFHFTFGGGSGAAAAAAGGGAESGSGGESALYSFWVAGSACGASHGFVAGGGPGIPGDTDTLGSC